jgi:hypothetical protein
VFNLLIPLFRLINSLERDSRKNFVSKEENDYIHKTIENLTNLILNQSSTILGEQLFDYSTQSLME